ncbi:hypothetical protein HN011_006981 [Eciton burchellii]|nr:hypothetical protein HN011_006981 [Eciton burchellii]
MYGAAPNRNMISNIKLAGSTIVDEQRSGTEYSDPYRTWDKVVVQSTIRITLKDYAVTIDRTTLQLIRPSGKHCARRGECLESENVQPFWSVIHKNSCQLDP